MRASLTLTAILAAAAPALAQAQEPGSPARVAPITTEALTSKQLLELWSEATGRSVKIGDGFADVKQTVVRGRVTAEQIEQVLAGHGTFLLEVNSQVVATARWKAAQILTKRTPVDVRADGKGWPEGPFAYVRVRLKLGAAEARALHTMAARGSLAAQSLVTATVESDGLSVEGRTRDVRKVLDWAALFASGPAQRQPRVSLFRVDAKTWATLSAAPAKKVELAFAKTKPLAEGDAIAGTDLTGNLTGLGPFSLQVGRDPAQPPGSANEFDFTLVSPRGTVSMRLHVAKGVVARTLPDGSQLVLLVR